MKLLTTLIFLMLAAPALAQTDLTQYQFPQLDSSQLDSMWMLGTIGATGEIEWRYVNPQDIGDHCNASRGHYLAGDWQDTYIQTAELSPSMGDVSLHITPAVLSIGETRMLELDTTPPNITVMPSVGTETRTIKSDYSGETYRAGTGYFHDPSGTLGDTTYLIDYKGKAPSIYQLSRIDTKPSQPARKYLFMFKKQKSAQVVSEIVGYGFIALGAYLGGKAEYYSRYHGTTSNNDTYHITRDAGLVSTGFGAICVGTSFGLDDKLEYWELGLKGFGMLLGYRSIAEATYNRMKK